LLIADLRQRCFCFDNLQSAINNRNRSLGRKTVAYIQFSARAGRDGSKHLVNTRLKSKEKPAFKCYRLRCSGAKEWRERNWQTTPVPAAALTRWS